jgi:hypothetical protein
MPIQTKPNWQPLSLLPLVALTIDEAVRNSKEQHEAFSEAKDKPHVLDNETISRATQLYKAQLEDMRLYEEQLKRWQMQPLTGDQRGEVDRLLDQLPRVKQLSEAILEMLNDIKENTIDRGLEKRDSASNKGKLAAGEVDGPNYPPAPNLSE